mgnify:CR=1 FL=1
MSDRAVLEAVELGKTYRDARREIVVLEGLALSVSAGEWLAIVGASGACFCAAAAHSASARARDASPPASLARSSCLAASARADTSPPRLAGLRRRACRRLLAQVELADWAARLRRRAAAPSGRRRTWHRGRRVRVRPPARRDVLVFVPLQRGGDAHAPGGPLRREPRAAPRHASPSSGI